MRIGLLFILFSFNLFAAEESVIKNYSDEEQIRYESIWKGMADAEMVTPLSELEAKYLEIDSNSDSILGAGAIVQDYINLIPDSNFKRGLVRYMSIVDPKSYSGSSSGVGGANQGIETYYNLLFEDNPCFSQLAQGFYSEINEIDDSHTIYRPQMSDKSGDKNNEALKPGWLLNKAKQYTQGDPNLALMLIGACGHDDAAEASINTSVGREKIEYGEALAAIDYRISGFFRTLKYFETNKNQVGISFVKKELAKLIELKKQMTPTSIKALDVPIVRKSSLCHKLTDQKGLYYLPQSLGESADISEESKKVIASYQAPKDGLSRVPAKHYHILASAVMGCNLAQEGISPELAANIQKFAAWAYRTIRISDKIYEDIESWDNLQDAYSKYREQFAKKTTGRRGRTKIVYEPHDSLEEWVFKNTREDSFHFNQFGVNIDFYDLESIEDWNYYQARFDAALLMEKHMLGGKILGFQLPITNLRLNFQPLGDMVELNELDKFRDKLLKRRAGRNRRAVNGWGKGRYERAVNKAMSYIADWDWTMKQHEIGARFGAQQCKPSLLKRPDDKACEILSNLKNNPRTGCIRKTVDGEDSVPIEMAVKLNRTADFLGQVSEDMQKNYLDPNISSEQQDDTTEVNELY